MPDRHPISKTVISGAVALIVLFLLPLFFPRYYVYLFSLIFVMGLLATSLNLVLGFGGLYQFNHAVFYGVGAYAFALFIDKSALPSWLGYLAAPICPERCWPGHGVDHGAPVQTLFRHAANFAGVACLGHCLSMVFLYRRRRRHSRHTRSGPHRFVHGVYYFTLAVSVAVCLIRCIGLCILLWPDLSGDPGQPRTMPGAGYPCAAPSACREGLAGFLPVWPAPCLSRWKVRYSRICCSGPCPWKSSSCACSGAGSSFLGPMLGAAIIVILRTFVGIYTEYWTMVLGIVLMLIIFFLPEGVLGFLLKKTRTQHAAIANE